MAAIRKMDVGHFVRHLKQMLQEQEAQFAFFLGAGCSISSGIPGAKALVEQWLPRLYTQMTGNSGTPDVNWPKTEFPEYDASNPAASYAKVMRRLFPSGVGRQREIERIVRGQDPGFGYAVFAKLITMDKCGPHCNLVLTTNFDDLVADALYLYTRQKPLVIVHESLVGFVESGRTRPLVIKLHGDALLDPKNTEDEVRELNSKVCGVLNEQMAKRGLVFLGYGGNDAGVTSFLQKLPQEALTWGIYWVNKTIPDNDFGNWLQARPNSVWVDHLSFDELMVLIRAEFNLAHPEEARFGKLMETYRQTFESLTKAVETRPESEEKEALKSAVEKATEEAKDWWSVVLKARPFVVRDPAKADEIYRDGLEKYPNSSELVGTYALFLLRARMKFDEAESLFLRALEANAEQPWLLSSYAAFLWQVRKRSNEAEAYLRRALECDPNDQIALCNYASFLFIVPKDFATAEVFYRRAVETEPQNPEVLNLFALFLYQAQNRFDEAELLFRRAIDYAPKDAWCLGYYAYFLWQIRKKFDDAEAYFRRALRNDPHNATNLCNYGGFLISRGNRQRGLNLLRRSLQLALRELWENVMLECQFYFYAHGSAKDISPAFGAIRALLLAGVHSNWTDFSQNIDRAEKDGHPNVALLKALAAVITQDAPISTLDEFEEWRTA